MGEVLALVDDLGLHYNVDMSQLHAFGFSDGGLFAAVTGMAHSTDFASLAIMGYGWGATYPILSPSREIPIQFICGSADSFYSGAVDAQSYMAGVGHDSRLVTANGVGHSFAGLHGAAPAADVVGWMLSHPL